jgi:hypothetical protein
VPQEAVWLSRRRRIWCRRDALPVISIVRGHTAQRWEQDVLVDWLAPTLETAASRPHPTMELG